MQKSTTYLIIIGVIALAIVTFFAWPAPQESTSSLESSSSSASGNTAPSAADLTPPSSSDNAQEPSGISSSELANHNVVDDCWVAYKGKVYDITSFIPNHKDYEKLLVPLCGTGSEFETAFTGKHGTSKVGVLINQTVLKGEFTS